MMPNGSLTRANDGRCPYCGERLTAWEPNPWHGFVNDMLICSSNDCRYFRDGRRTIADVHGKNFAYRYCYDPVLDNAFPLIAWCGGELSYLKGRCPA